MTISKKLFGLTAALLFSFSAFAETLAIVDRQAVFTKVPQTMAMQQQLTQEFAAQTEEIKKLESDIKFNVEKFQRESAIMSDEQKTTLRTQIEELQKSYQAKAQPLEQQVRRRQAEERNKIIALINQAVQIIAADEKIDIVLDAQAAVYVAKANDITEKVIEKVTKLN